MQEILLPCGHTAIVDDEDYDELMQYNWRSCPGKYTIYVIRSTSRLLPGPRTTISMHRHILKPIGKQEIDHINRNGLDNQRANIRIVTRSFNVGRAKAHSDNPLNYKGVTKVIQAGHVQYQARITENRKRTFLGIFATPEEAAAAYDLAALSVYGTTTMLNSSRD